VRRYGFVCIGVAMLMSLGIVASAYANVDCASMGACAGHDDCPSSWGSVEGEGCDFECCPNPGQGGYCYELYCSYDDP
jgi:hypothetical protein